MCLGGLVAWLLRLKLGILGSHPVLVAVCRPFVYLSHWLLDLKYPSDYWNRSEPQAFYLPDDHPKYVAKDQTFPFTFFYYYPWLFYELCHNSNRRAWQYFHKTKEKCLQEENVYACFQGEVASNGSWCRTPHTCCNHGALA